MSLESFDALAVGFDGLDPASLVVRLLALGSCA